ncbi:RNA-binding protein [candidate division WWE3 bacterium RIFCSPLOWO2_01_FULL_42_11]|uniref:RNA-binding protein n=1 Tax=candidate division WWE3 bacterium RIFCSPLOWO2_01_FULL_42_11 TaxID=1802627 RepID=A0A1F4VRT7_UNCKA|nr:MAG: RNA-binding protein [candidate division WWE3 bacterium RIFCSPLOWO2_01_FULL_42_11]
MAVKLFVGNLPYKATSEELGQLFSQAGNVVSAEVVMDRMSGRSRGFGFVEMESDGAAQAAVSQFNGHEMDGRKLVVNVARPREDRPQSGGGGYERRREEN